MCLAAELFLTEGRAMFRVDAGRTQSYCDGVSRRSFVQLGMAGMASLGLADLLRRARLAMSLKTLPSETVPPKKTRPPKIRRSF